MLQFTLGFSCKRSWFIGVYSFFLHRASMAFWAYRHTIFILVLGGWDGLKKCRDLNYSRGFGSDKKKVLLCELIIIGCSIIFDKFAPTDWIAILLSYYSIYRAPFNVCIALDGGSCADLWSRPHCVTSLIIVFVVGLWSSAEMSHQNF